MSMQTIPIGELFSQTWVQYKRRALPIIAVILISSVLIVSVTLVMALSGIFGGVILTHFMGKMTGIFIITALMSVLLCIIIILIIWCQATALAIVLDEDVGIIEAFQQGWYYLWPLTWVLTIFSGILMTGFALGFLPAFLFLVWFSFCAFILFEEDMRGMGTLLLSREYVRGYGWNIFGKMCVIWLLSFIAWLIPFLGQILSILFAPFLMLYLLIMYRDLKSIKGTLELDAEPGRRIFWWVVSVIGLVLPIAALAGLLFSIFSGGTHSLDIFLEGMHGTTL